MTKNEMKSKRFSPFDHHPNWHKVLDINTTSKFTDDIGLPDETARANKISALLGLPILGVGGSRVVLSFQSFVVKIPLESFGYVENDNEKAFWQQLPEEYRQYFAAFIEGNDTYVIQEKVQPLDCTNLEQLYYQERKNIGEALARNGIILDDAEEDRDDQWGRRQHQLVVLDYGRCYATE